MREGWAEKDTAEKDAVAKDTAVTGWAEAWDIAAEAAALWAVVQRRWWLEAAVARVAVARARQWGVACGGGDWREQKL